MERISINLDLKPQERWNCIETYNKEINQLIGMYLKDLEDISFFESVIEYYKMSHINDEYMKELEGITTFTDFNVNQLLLANLYYDALKLVFGCTAFSLVTEQGNLHARNLDWWSESNLLKKYSKIFDFKKNGKTVFSSVGWPGFIGVFSGLKAKKYAITLNAVLSQEQPKLAAPITFKIRKVLESKDSYEDAVKILANVSIASDCLILITGTKEQERLVIERTPTIACIRKPDAKNNLVVTNAYLKMENKSIPGDVLQESSCTRQNRALELLNKMQPESIQDCFHIISDAKIKIGITMQQMVFNINKGTIYIRE